MKYGYARVSTDDQNADMQMKALSRAGCKKVFKDEGLSGADYQAPRPAALPERLKDGDTLIVWKLDRLARSLRDLITLIEDFNTGHQFPVAHRGHQHHDARRQAGLSHFRCAGGIREGPDYRTYPRRHEGRPRSRRSARPEAEVDHGQQIEHARKLIAQGERHEDVARPVQGRSGDALPGTCGVLTHINNRLGKLLCFSAFLTACSVGCFFPRVGVLIAMIIAINLHHCKGIDFSRLKERPSKTLRIKVLGRAAKPAVLDCAARLN